MVRRSVLVRCRVTRECGGSREDVGLSLLRLDIPGLGRLKRVVWWVMPEMPV